MKIMKIIGIFLLAILLFSQCKKEEIPENQKGFIKFSCINPVSSAQKGHLFTIGSDYINPPLTGPVTTTEMMTMRITIGDVWISKGTVSIGIPDTLEWVRLTTTTNRNPKLFEEYSFPSQQIPVGNYKSVKITFRNVFYRIVRLISDTTVVYELLETMGSWTDYCDEADTSWAKTNYFGPDGNHYLNDQNRFEMASEGERISGINITSDKTALVYWRLGAGVTEPCTNYLMDENGNLEWDCGVDYINIECPPEMEYMWDFVIEYE